MIPKIIHYCWFGNNPKTELVLKCIESWKKYLSDYEIIEWNETNTNLTDNRYVREAYENKKWAFVSDYVRLKVLYDYGGIYLDTDVEVINNLDEFLNDKAFSGFEDDDKVPTGIIASEKAHPFIFELLSYYDNASFICEDGKLNLTTNVTIITNYAITCGLVLNNTFQSINQMNFYPKDYFCPKDGKTGVIKITKNTKCIHHFSSSWMDSAKKRDMNNRRKYSAKFGIKLGGIIFVILKLFFYLLHPYKLYRRIVYREIG